MANKELENAISVLKSNKTIQKLYLKFLDEFMKPNEDKSLTSSPATTAAVIVDGESPGEDNIRFLMPLKDFNTEKKTDEIIGKCEIRGPIHAYNTASASALTLGVNAPKEFID